MPGSPELIRDLLHQAKAARAARDNDAARAAYAKSFDQAREERDVPAMGEAALGLVAMQAYGVHPGRIPAFLFEAYSAADGDLRTRLAAAIVRSWAYSGDPQRGIEFAEEAVTRAEQSSDAALLADALDAQLLMRWGPDDFAERLRITSRLEDAVAYVADVEARMSAHLWRLTTAVESLDMNTVRRQLRALDRLAVDSGSHRVLFFAAARQSMHALVIGDLDAARGFREQAIEAGTTAEEPDTYAIDHVLASEIARQAHDVDALVRGAVGAEEFGIAEGNDTVLAEAADLWFVAGEAGRAHDLLLQVAGAGLAAIPRNPDWLLVVSLLTGVAASVGEVELADEGLHLLEPYAGRGVPNGGAAAFFGVVDAYLSASAAALGRNDDSQRWARSAAALSERFGAAWWTTDRSPTPPPTVRALHASVAHLQPGPDGVWTVGPAGATVAMREVKGFHYLRLLLRQPGVDITALDLSDWASGHAGHGIDEAPAGDVIDRQALAAYRERIAQIDTEIDEAAEWADEGRLARLRAERDALIDEIAIATGLGGRVRQTGSTAERARVAVRKAIAAAIDRIAQVDASLGRALRDSVQTGNSCRYDPDPGRALSWVIDPRG